MTQKVTDTLERLVFPNLEIRLRLERVVVDHYDPSPEEEQRRIWVESSTPEGDRQTETIDEFCELLRRVDPRLLSDERVSAAANIAATLLDAGRVVVPDGAYEFLEKQFAIDLAAHATRFEQGHLRFLGVKYSLATGVTSLRSVDIDLNSSHVAITSVPTK